MPGSIPGLLPMGNVSQVKYNVMLKATPQNEYFYKELLESAFPEVEITIDHKSRTTKAHVDSVNGKQIQELAYIAEIIEDEDSDTVIALRRSGTGITILITEEEF